MKKERGNILFLILLAVVLFAALSYAVTSSMRGGGTDASGEKATAQAAELMNYFAQMDAAVQRMMLTGGVKDYELNFLYRAGQEYLYGTYDNTNCTENRCRVFHPDGGGVSGKRLEPYTRNASIPGRIAYLNIPGVGTSAPDIVFAFHQPRTDICREINKRIGVNDIIYNATWPQSSSTIMYQFAIPAGPIPNSGNNLSANVTPNVGSAGTFCTCQLADQASCEADNYNPMIWHVLVAR